MTAEFFIMGEVNFYLCEKCIAMDVLQNKCDDGLTITKYHYIEQCWM